VALCFGWLLKHRGAAHVALTARRSEPLAFAREHGAADATLAIDEPVADPDRFDAMIETTGSLHFATSQLARIRSAGDIYAYAIYPEMGDESAFSPLGRDHRFQRIDPHEAAAHDAVRELVADHQLPGREWITHHFDLADWREAWRTVTDRRTLKTVVRF
jgi:threonine dehydrogenase-like Zn-dependent dehydrogenase